MYTENCGGKSEGKIALGTSRDTWNDIFQVDLKEIRVEDIDFICSGYGSVASFGMQEEAHYLFSKKLRGPQSRSGPF
jgi:hypothetical protein